MNLKSLKSKVSMTVTVSDFGSWRRTWKLELTSEALVLRILEESSSGKESGNYCLGGLGSGVGVTEICYESIALSGLL